VSIIFIRDDFFKTYQGQYIQQQKAFKYLGYDR
jgi:hypothetical protein